MVVVKFHLYGTLSVGHGIGILCFVLNVLYLLSHLIFTTPLEVGNVNILIVHVA